MEYILSPSLLACDFSRLGEEIKTIDEAGAQYIHIDVMDGSFVPSISFGMPVIKSIRKTTSRVFDVHLMIQDPDRYIEEFAAIGSDLITVHAEACTHLDRTIQLIHSTGKKAGVALNPATPLSSIEWVLDQVDMVLLMTVNPGFGGQSYLPYGTRKVAALRQMLNERGLSTDIQVDGGVTLDNLKEIKEAGANIFVAGSAVFKGNARDNVHAFLEQL